MKYIYTLAGILLFSTSLFSQSNCKFGIGFHFSPDYTFNNFRNNDSIQKSWERLRNQKEKAVLGYTSGFTIQAKLVGILSFETGLNYTRKTAESQWDTTINGAKTVWNEQSFFNYLQLPLKLKLHFASGKTTVYITAGTSGMMVLDAFKNVGVSGATPSKQTIQNSFVKQFNSSVLLSIGFDFQLAKRVFLRLEPNVSKTMDSIRKDGITNILASAGVNFGLFFKIKK